MLNPQFILPIAHELVIDLFAGGGGASTGIEQAIGRHVDIAINHDPEAVALHQANHPQTLHYVSDVFEVDPVAGVDVRKLTADVKREFEREDRARAMEADKAKKAAADAKVDAGKAAKGSKTTPPPAAPAEPGVLAVGVRVKVLDSARNPRVAKYVGKEGTVTHKTGPDAWDVTFKGRTGGLAGFHTTELQVVAAAA